MDNQEMTAATETVKKKRNRGSNWMNPDDGTSVTGSDKQRILKEVMARSSLFNKNIGRPLKYEPEEVESRVCSYFLNCMDKEQRPTITGLCNVLDITNETLIEWEGNASKPFSEIVKKARNFIKDFEEQAALEGHTNTIYAIWRDKVIWGYVEKQTIEIAPASPLGAPTDPAQLEAYIAEKRQGVVLDD